ncbi:MAG TPA: FAD-dependent oxidoreductase [Puia sp.]|jgi:glycine/D-amino acid oxidase-like deaminating enzyme|nr:FAD-dependent oxidoreductase [Puia sp.]
MDLRTAYPFWLLDKGILGSYPSLEKDISTEVAIIGAGISGALIAWQLCHAGIKCVMVDRRHVGMGSTAATTGLLQYEIDTPLSELITKTGHKNATESYLLCAQAIDELAKLSSKHRHAGFARRPSFQYASFAKDIPLLKKEYTLRRSIGLKLDWMDEKDIKTLYGFNKQAGLLSKKGAVVNAYGLTHSLLSECRGMGLKIYDHTAVKTITHHKRSIQLITTDKHHIHARKVIIACGYESGAYLPKRVDILSTTYAIVSEPIPEKMLWHENSLIWETASPYLYLRTTGDRRIMIGGKDDASSSAYKRERSLPRKVKELEHSFARLFPHIRWKTDFHWAGLFAGTKDGLPYIGSLPQRRHLYFALGFGGNGIVFSQIAAVLLKDQITDRKNPYAQIFRFDR